MTMDAVKEKKSAMKIMKKPLAMFKRKNVLDEGKGTRSLSSQSSVVSEQEHYMANHRASSISGSEVDADESLLVDKFGFIIEPSETENESVLEDEAAAPSVKELSSLFHFRRGSLIQDKSFRAAKVTDAKDRGWPQMLGLDAIIANKEGLYNDLVALSAADPQKDPNESQSSEFRNEWDAIERDLKRTFPKHSLFRESQIEGQDEGGDSDEASQLSGEVYGKQALRRVLRACSVYDMEIGYCQGMNFIVGMFLMFLTEEEAFWLLVVIMNDEPFKLREVFSRDMAGTHEILYISDRLVNCFLPELYDHFENEQVNTSMFTTQWLMTIFTSTFPFGLVSKVWDSFLGDGWKIVYKVLIALLRHAQRDGDLLNKNMEDTLVYLREFQSKVDPEQILSLAHDIPLKQRHIKRYATEFRKLRDAGEIEVHEVLRRPDSASIGSASTSLMGLPKLGKAHRFVIKLKRHKRNITVEDISAKLVPVFGSAKFAVLLNDAFSPEELAGLLKRSKGEAFESVVMKQPGGKDAATILKFKRAIVEDEDLADVLYDRVVGALEDMPELWERFSEASWTKKTSNVPLKATGLNHKFHFLKYGYGDFAVPLRDGAFSRGNEKSYITMQLYLNDGFKGGMTSFKGTKKHYDVKAKPGSILLFDQDIRHEECEVVKGRRHVLRSEVMYAPHSSAYQYECTI